MTFLRLYSITFTLKIGLSTLAMNCSKTEGNHSKQEMSQNITETDRRVNAECPESKQAQVSDKIFCMQ